MSSLSGCFLLSFLFCSLSPPIVPSLSMARELFVPALSVALVGFSFLSAMGSVFAHKHGYQFDSSQVQYFEHSSSKIALIDFDFSEQGASWEQKSPQVHHSMCLNTLRRIHFKGQQNHHIWFRCRDTVPWDTLHCSQYFLWQALLAFGNQLTPMPFKPFMHRVTW